MTMYDCQVFRSRTVKIGKRQVREIADPDNGEFLVAHLNAMLKADHQKPAPGISMVVYKKGTYQVVARVTL
jgi:hypothetical protein